MTSPTFRWCMGVSLAAALFLCWGMAFAQTITCSAPTTFVGGAAIPAGTVITFKAYKGATAAAASAGTTVVGTATVCSFTDATATPGTYYTVSAIVGGVESDRLTPLPWAPKPNPPSNLQVLSVVADTTVYKLRQTVDGFAFVSIGSAPLNTQCSAQSIGEFNVVPRSAVTLRSRFDTLPLITFARCG